MSSTRPYVDAARRTLGFLATLGYADGAGLPQLNLGGGHAIAYLPHEATLAPERIARALRAVVESECRRLPLTRPRLTVEPGRAIAGPSGVTVYRVINVKRSRARTWVAVDGGMSDNPRPALYGARYSVRLVGRHSAARTAPVTVVGVHCEAGDVLITDATLPSDIRAGDLLAVPATGAYHHVMASNYNSVP